MRPGEGYGEEPQRRREAWSIDNLGNRAARGELLEAIWAAAGEQIGGSEPLLDCGCGTGWLLEALTARGAAPERLHGVDRDQSRVTAARERAQGARVSVGDANDLRFPDEAFAAVFFVVSLSSMDSRQAARAALVEGRRVLQPGGVLVAYEPRIPNPLNRTTCRITRRDFAAAGAVPAQARSLTLFPPVGRRLGRLTGVAHPLLSKPRPLRSHVLTTYRKAEQGTTT